MKKFFVSLALVSSFLFADAKKFSLKNFSVAIDAGSTYSRIKSYEKDNIKQPNLPDSSQKFSVSYYASAGIRYAYKERWTFASSIGYLVNAIHYTASEVHYPDADSNISDAYADIHNNTHFLCIPLTVSYSLLKKKNTPFITAGTGMNIYLGTQEKYSMRSDADGAELAKGDSKTRRGEYNKSNITFALGGGYKYALSKKYEFAAEATYNYSTRKLVQDQLNVAANHRINFFKLGFSFICKL